MKTRQEIENLKANWDSDPCWDIEDTEGFQGHVTELYQYRKTKEFEWEIDKLQKCVQLGVTENLFKLIESLKLRIKRLETKQSEE
jgi:hypothetical protein